MAQITAYELGCDMDKISMRAAMTVVCANANVTGGSVGSDVNLWVSRKGVFFSLRNKQPELLG